MIGETRGGGRGQCPKGGDDGERNSQDGTVNEAPSNERCTRDPTELSSTEPQWT